MPWGPLLGRSCLELFDGFMKSGVWLWLGRWRRETCEEEEVGEEAEGEGRERPSLEGNRAFLGERREGRSGCVACGNTSKKINKKNYIPAQECNIVVGLVEGLSAQTDSEYCPLRYIWTQCFI